MLEPLPHHVLEFSTWPWEKIEPYFDGLHTHPIDASNVAAWLKDWTLLAELIAETYQRLWVATTVDTTDEAAAERYQRHLEGVYPQAQAASQKLKEKLLASGLEPAGFEIPLRNMQQQAALFREENLPLLSEELSLSSEYDKLIGDQTVIWQGQEVTLLQISTAYLEPDREQREKAWHLYAQRWLADRQAINDLWGKLFPLRCQLAANAGEPDYRLYRWKQQLRFDYTPEDCFTFHQAIEEVVVPVAERIYERRRQRLGVDRLRPWDLDVDPIGMPPLKPFETVEQLESGVASMFARVDPQLAAYYEIMRREKLLDLDNRKGKAPGGYCTEFAAVRRPFIFMNSVGIHDDVQTLLHEGGHAFHAFEAGALPYYQQHEVGLEFCEVASMGMEFLASPYLPLQEGGFYSQQDAARARLQHLEGSLLFWPYMAVVDAFQHWAYTHPAAATHPSKCDAEWARLWGRFMRGVDWSGLDQEMATGWQRKAHIHQEPFYYVEYGLAQLGAMQIWRNSLSDQAGAVAAYRRALALGGSVSLPQLFTAAGAKFAFDAATLEAAVTLAEQTIETLEDQLLNG
jgi:oligoendopeptidase F